MSFFIKFLFPNEKELRIEIVLGGSVMQKEVRDTLRHLLEWWLQHLSHHPLNTIFKNKLLWIENRSVMNPTQNDKKKIF